MKKKYHLPVDVYTRLGVSESTMRSYAVAMENFVEGYAIHKLSEDDEKGTRCYTDFEEEAMASIIRRVQKSKSKEKINLVCEEVAEIFYRQNEITEMVAHLEVITNETELLKDKLSNFKK